MKANSPIGIFDSGIGGLTVAKAIQDLLPCEKIIYFGDTEHMPYGGKSNENILAYSIRIADYLVEQGCKIIVIACNSASSIAYDFLQKKYEGKIAVVGMIAPVAIYLNTKGYKKVGIIGTKPTIKSKAHELLIHAANHSIKVNAVATPLLAPMIEEGFYNNNISQTIINSYLQNRRLTGIQALVLACTHYPLIKKEVLKFYKKEIDVVDPSSLVAASVQLHLAAQKLLFKGKKGKDLFLVSDYTESFEKSTKQFYNQAVHIVEKAIWAGV